MPQVIAAAATAIVAAVGVTGTTAAVASTLLAAAFNAGISIGISALLSPKVGAAEGAPTTWSADPNAGIPFVVGRRGVAGQIVYREAYGEGNQMQSIVSVYSGAGPINAFSTWYGDAVAYTFDGTTKRCTAPTSRVNTCWLDRRTGAQPDTALAWPSPGWGTPTGWSTSHDLSGKACSMLTLWQNEELTTWPAGEPKPIQVIQGLLAWDPRLDGTWPGGSGACRLATPSTWVYSTNPAIHALKWCLGYKENGVFVGGIGAAVGSIDVAAFIEAANIADTNGWTISGVPYSTDDKYQVLQAMLQAAGALPARRAGMISCVTRGAIKTSLVTVSAADTAGPVQLNMGSPREGRINTIIPRCVQEDQDWEMVALDPVIGAGYVTEDGGRTRSRGIDYPYVSDKDQAAQLAYYDIADSREPISGTIPFKPYMRDLDPGDCFTITDTGLALSGQKCVVLSRDYDPASDVVTIQFRGETDAKHTAAAAISGTAPPAPVVGGGDPYTVDTPSLTDWSLAPGDGVAALKIDRLTTTDLGNSGVLIEYREDGATDWIAWGEVPPATKTVELTGLTSASVDYEVALRYRNNIGILGSTPLVFTPEAVPAVAITGQGDLATLDQVDSAEIVAGAVINGKIGAAAIEGEEVAPIASLVVGTGDASFHIDGANSLYRAWAGAITPEAAPWRVTSGGKMIATDFEQRLEDGTLYWSSSGGLTDAGLNAIFSNQAGSTAFVSVGSGGALHLASAPTTNADQAAPSTFAARLGADSDATITATCVLQGANFTDTFPSTVTLTLYEAYRALDTDPWGNWASIGTKSLTKTTGTAGSTEYQVIQSTADYWDIYGVYTPYTFYEPVTKELTVSVAVAAKPSGFYRYCAVGPLTSPWFTAATTSTVTFSDTDGVPSVILGDGADISVNFAHPLGFTRGLDISQTVTAQTDVDVSVNLAVLYTASGVARTIRNYTGNPNVTAVYGSGGNLDVAGIKAANRWLHLWLISDGVTDDTLFSLSPTTPIMPSGFSFKMRIGAVRINSANTGVAPFRQHEDEFTFYMYSTFSGATQTLVDPLPVLHTGLVGTGSTNPPSYASAAAASTSYDLYSIAEVSAGPSTVFSANVRVVGVGSNYISVAPTSLYGKWTPTGPSGAAPVYIDDNSAVTAWMTLFDGNIYCASSHANHRVELLGFRMSLG